jgi:hypothetical protein
VNWPTELVATRGVLNFPLQSPAVSPFDFTTAAMVVTHRGLFRPATLRLGSDGPRVTLDHEIALRWTGAPWRTVTDANGEPQVIPEFTSGPHSIPLDAAPAGACGSR